MRIVSIIITRNATNITGLAQKNQTPTYESLKTSAAQDSVLPIFRKEPMTNPDTSNNKIADPNKKDKNEQIDNHK